MSLEALVEAARARPYTHAQLMAATRDLSLAPGTNPELGRIVRVDGAPGVVAARVILSLDETEPGKWHRHASIAAHSASGGFVQVEAAIFGNLLDLLGFGQHDIQAVRSDTHGGAVWHYYEVIPDPREEA